jgi:hypothetical protein
VNTANPGPASPQWSQPGPKPCAADAPDADINCAYNYGWNAATAAFDAIAKATSPAVAGSHRWWLDVETANSWSDSTQANAFAIYGFIDGLNKRGVGLVGIYSSPYAWSQIAGKRVMSQVANWVATAPDAASAPAYCGRAMTGGPVAIVQYETDTLDGDYVCDSAPPDLREAYYGDLY